ncbi:uncharacterized protein LOC110464531 isoform X2 [Mizuhopecten yessoensis]|nr:uncharacterized protein LOC110464531 isoform X2 [Mizuhopecten yessoensis]
MLFLTIITRVVYWYMDHNNPAKLAKQEKELQKVKSCVKTVKFAEPEKKQILIHTATENNVELIKEKQKGEMNSEKLKTEYKCTGCTDEDSTRRRQWEKNEIDYMGLDSFDNIMAKLDQSMSK